MPNLLYTISLINTYRNTLINSAIIIYFNCGKNSYFIISYPELKDIDNIKEIEEKEISNKLKKTLGKDSPLGYPINLKEINLN